MIFTTLGVSFHEILSVQTHFMINLFEFTLPETSVNAEKLSWIIVTPHTLHFLLLMS